MKITPMLRQYLDIKLLHKEYILLYHMGDFYEMFFEDAVSAAKVLSIALTKRGDVPMCGMPIHASTGYINKLLKNGLSVAICDQTETPSDAKKRGYKEIVRREVTRIITPGTVLEEDILNEKMDNNVCSVFYYKEKFYCAVADISTGSFLVLESSKETIYSDIMKFEPKEVIVPHNLLDEKWLNNFNIVKRAETMFSLNRAIACLKDFFSIHDLAGLELSEPEIIVSGVLVEYIRYTQKANTPRLLRPKKLDFSRYLKIDNITYEHLGILDDLRGVIDFTCTAGGSRLLYSYLKTPILDKNAIEKRLDKVEYFYNEKNLIKALSSMLKKMPDIVRILGRVSVKDSIKDIQLIKVALLVVSNEVKNVLSKYSIPESIKTHYDKLVICNDVLEFLDSVLAASNSIDVNLGEFVKYGYDREFDSLRDHLLELESKIVDLEDEYRKTSGVNRLKISRNNVIGYFIEVGKNNSKDFDSTIFRHRQTIGSNNRFSTDKLDNLQVDIEEIREKISLYSKGVMNKIRDLIISRYDDLSSIYESLSMIDVYLSLAIAAEENNYVRPHINEVGVFDVKDSRHPVIETLQNMEFVSNDICLNEKNIWIITGPNMAGKSTFLRQVALISFMAQIGSFVPASMANLCLVDRIFTRIGAGDSLAKGNSTFMNEMLETSIILNQATDKSLVILDELGRGTSTYDGFSIAQAVLENIASKIKCKTLFATHYQELAKLEKVFPNVQCYTVSIKEWDNDIIFLHKIVKGVSNKSYGIHVANIAGLPEDVVERAKHILADIEENGIKTVVG